MSDEIYLMDGAENVGTNQNRAQEKWSTTLPFAVLSISSNAYIPTSAASRWSGQMGMSLGTGVRWHLCTFNEDKIPLVISASWRISSATTAKIMIFEILDSSAVYIARFHCDNGVLQMVDSAGNPLWTDAAALATGQWITAELGIRGSSTEDGWIELRIDGSSVFSAANINIGNVRAVRWGKTTPTGYGSTGTHHFDDVVFSNYFTGGGRVRRIDMVADSAVQFSRDAGDTNVGRINEEIHDVDASYVFSGTVDHKDLYDMDDLPEGVNNIAALQITAVARIDNTDARKFRLALKLGAAEVESDEMTPISFYRYFSHVFQNKPGGSGFSSGDFATPFQAGFRVTE